MKFRVVRVCQSLNSETSRQAEAGAEFGVCEKMRFVDHQVIEDYLSAGLCMKLGFL